MIKNPIVRDEQNKIMKAESGLVKNQLGLKEVRLWDNPLYMKPFPLYPFEELEEDIQPLRIIPIHEGLLVRALYNFMDGKIPRKSGDEYLIRGPTTYIPKIEEGIVKATYGTVIFFLTII